jgi:iron complex outermembrane receptor protein
MRTVLAILFGLGVQLGLRAWSADAQPQEILLDIPAQPLASALTTMGAQARVQVLFDEASVAGRSAPALQGRYTPHAALTQLLRGTTLLAVAAGPDTFTVQPASPTSAPSTAVDPLLVLPEVTVQERRDRGYLPTRTTAGSQLDLPPRDQVNVIQAVPRLLLDDRGVIDILEGIDTVPGLRPIPRHTRRAASASARGDSRARTRSSMAFASGPLATPSTAPTSNAWRCSKARPAFSTASPAPAAP